MKRYKMPSWWPLEKKTKKYVITPSPGPHSIKTSLPLGVVLRDMFKFSETNKESKQILNSRKVKVDGFIRTKLNFPVGVMDIVEIGDKKYRIMPSKKGFEFVEISGENSNSKLVRLRDKKILKKGKIQLNLHDGKNIIVEKDEYKSGDSIIYDIEKKTLIGSIPMKEGSKAIIFSGKNKGSKGIIQKIIKSTGLSSSLISMKTDEREIITRKDQAYVIGDENVEVL